MLQTVSKLPPWLTWGLGFPLIILNGWLLLLVVQFFQPLVSVFLVAILLSFILDYPVKFLENRGVQRSWAVSCIFLLASLILVAFGITLAPLILKQINDLANSLPSWIDSGSQQLQVFQDWAAAQKLPIDLIGLVTQLTNQLSNQLQSFSSRILSFALDTVGSVLNILLTVVLTFYLLLHGERLWNGLFQWLPLGLGIQVQRSLYQNFNNYFVGEATLAGFIGLAITLMFLILQVPFGLLFGIGIGLLDLFPFGTGIGIGLVALLVSLQDFWLGIKVLAIGILIDQVNANFVAPRVLGRVTGLNPVWILVSLLVGVKIGGIIGLLVAVPTASFIKTTADSLRTSKWKEITSLPQASQVPSADQLTTKTSEIKSFPEDSFTYVESPENW